MHPMKNIHERGFSLLEVLITLVVLAVGLVALAKFQGTSLESGSLAKGRTVAAHIAQEKLDDLRHYEMRIQVDAMGVAIGCTVNIRVSYRCIATNAGGNKNADFTLILPSGNLAAISGVTYNRTWTVTDLYFPVTGAGVTPNSAATATAPTLVPPYPDLKRVTVTVTWTDQDGVAQSVVLTSLISSSNPLYSGKVLE